MFTFEISILTQQNNLTLTTENHRFIIIFVTFKKRSGHFPKCKEIPNKDVKIQGRFKEASHPFLIFSLNL